MNYNELKAKIEETQKAIQEHGHNALLGAFRDFFEANPTIEAIRWTQYTPYFNDGDVCEFSVNDFSYRLADASGDEGDYGDGFLDTWGRDKPVEARAVSALYKAICDKSVFQAAFGDHVECTASPDGIAVKDYSHD